MVKPARTTFLCPVTIGRSAEIAALSAFLSQSGSVLLVSGEAGVGNSRIVREARLLAGAQGIRVLEGNCFEADRALPFAPALDILSGLVESHGIAEVARLAGGAAPDLARLLPELAPESPASGPAGSTWSWPNGVSSMDSPGSSTPSQTGNHSC